MTHGHLRLLVLAIGVAAYFAAVRVADLSVMDLPGVASFNDTFSTIGKALQ